MLGHRRKHRLRVRAAAVLPLLTRLLEHLLEGLAILHRLDQRVRLLDQLTLLDVTRRQLGLDFVAHRLDQAQQPLRVLADGPEDVLERLDFGVWR